MYDIFSNNSQQLMFVAEMAVILLKFFISKSYAMHFPLLGQKHWLEMTVYRDDESSALEKIPNIRCDTAADAQNVS